MCCLRFLWTGNEQKTRDLKLDESCISNPKSEISDWTFLLSEAVQFTISDFGFEMQDSSNFKIFS
jgi:hypothetical protein